MIRVELIHGDQRGWFAQSGRWLAVILSATAGCFLLYYLSVKNDLIADFLSSEPHYSEAVSHPLEIEVEDDKGPLEASATIADGTGEVVEVRGGSAVQAPVDTVHTSTEYESSIDRVEPAAASAPTGSLEITTACLSATHIVKELPSNSQFELFSCAAGRVNLSGLVTVDAAADSVEEELSEHLENIVSAVRKANEQANHISLSGDEKNARTTVLKTLSPSRATEFFAQVEYWADLCGIDDIDLGDQSVISTQDKPARWRRRLVGTGSYEQIQSFLDRVAAKEDFAVIGELILTPVSGADSYNKAVRISSAIDVFVSQ